MFKIEGEQDNCLVQSQEKFSLLTKKEKTNSQIRKSFMHALNNSEDLYLYTHRFSWCFPLASMVARTNFSADSIFH